MKVRDKIPTSDEEQYKWYVNGKEVWDLLELRIY